MADRDRNDWAVPMLTGHVALGLGLAEGLDRNSPALPGAVAGWLAAELADAGYLIVPAAPAPGLSSVLASGPSHPSWCEACNGPCRDES